MLTKRSSAAAFAAFLAVAFSSAGMTMQAKTNGGFDLDAVKADNIKRLTHRQPRFDELLLKVQARIAALQADPQNSAYGRRLAAELQSIEMNGAGESEERLKRDCDFLQAAASGAKPPTVDELKPLQAQYADLVAKIDDLALVKDFERLFSRHDKFVRLTSVGAFDKDRIAAELQSLDEMRESTPDIAFGAGETLKGLQQRRLAWVQRLVYMGTHPHEEQFLSRERPSLAVLEERSGAVLPLENADITIQSPQGAVVDLSTANDPERDLPFSPPLSLWMKSRMLEGRVPSITFRLADRQACPQALGVQDILDGKLDDYFKRNALLIAGTGQAAIVGLFDNFDRSMCANAFGKDGRTAFFMLDPKLPVLPADAAAREYAKKAEKGYYTSAKANWPELSNQFGDPNVPDGPERVAAAWKHLHDLLAPTTPCVAYFSTAGAFHGNKNACRFDAEAGNQVWNKLEYYYPGDGVLDWIGIEADAPDQSLQPKGANIVEAVDPFYFEVRTSKWQSLPVVLRAVAPARQAPEPGGESAWIASLFAKMIPGTYPNTGMVFLDAPEKLTLWSGDAATAYRSNVASNKAYNWKLRFKMLDKQ